MDQRHEEELRLIREAEEAHQAYLNMPPQARALNGANRASKDELTEVQRARKRLHAAQSALHRFWATQPVEQEVHG